MKNVCFMLVCLWVYHLQSQELIINGSFENFTSSLPDNWTEELGTHQEEIVTVSNGFKSVKITPVAPGAGMMSTSLFNQLFTLNSTESYTLSFDYYLPGDSSTSGVQNIRYILTNTQPSNAIFNDPGNAIVGSSLVYDNWTRISYELQIDSFRNGATSAIIKLAFSVNGGGNGLDETVYLDNVSVVPSSTLDVVDISNSNSIVTAIDSRAIHLKRDHFITDFQLYSIDGRIIDKGKVDATIIDISPLNQGVYVVTLETGDTTYAKKFIKH